MMSGSTFGAAITWVSCSRTRSAFTPARVKSTSTRVATSGEGIDPLHGLKPIDGTIDQLRRLEMHTIAGLLVDAGPKLAEVVA